jgi:DUF4097 and DUF4098 domain-containing protein YvlB
MSIICRRIALILVLTLPLNVGCVYASESATGSFERSLNVSGPIELEVTTGSGNIALKAGDASTVRVTATIRARDDTRLGAAEKIKALESNPPVEQSGQIIRIGRIDNPELRKSVSISYELVVPFETRLRSKTGSGNESIDGIRGPVEASTGSGNISITNVSDTITAKTGSGRIDLDSAKGAVRANTGSGSINAKRIAGGFVGGTGSGEVALEQTAPGEVDIQTGSGSVDVGGVQGLLRVRTGSGRITAAGQPSGAWNLHASSGSITISLPSQSAFDLHARTGSGRITIDHPFTVQGVVSSKELQGKVRGGGSMLEASTGSGDIRIQ